MNLVSRLARSARNRLQSLGPWLRAVPLQCWGLLGVFRVGPGLRVGRQVEIVCYGKLVIGNGVHLDDGAKLQVGPSGSMSIGDHCYIGRQTVLCANKAVTVGAHCSIAEGCSIRDANHLLDPEARRRETEVETGAIDIGDDVWIGSGVRVLRGASIGAGAVIGANAVVTGAIGRRTIAVGIPARPVRELPERPTPAGGGPEA